MLSTASSAMAAFPPSRVSLSLSLSLYIYICAVISSSNSGREQRKIDFVLQISSPFLFSIGKKNLFFFGLSSLFACFAYEDVLFLVGGRNCLTPSSEIMERLFF